MNRRPLLAGAAALSAVALTVTAGSAGAATTSSPAVGTASTTLELLDLLAGGHSLQAGSIALLSDTRDGTVARVTVTPVTADGTAYGTQTITPADSPIGVPAVSSPNPLASFVSLTSPAVDVTATNAPSTHAGATSLGSLTLLGLPVSLDGRLAAGASISKAEGAVGAKTVTLENLVLPSIADILAALGLDLSALPVGTLTDLVDQLALVTGAVTTAQGAVDTAQAAVNAAVADLATKTAAATAAQTALTSAQSVLTTATSTLETLLGEAAFVGTIADYAALPQIAKDLLAVAVPALPAAYLDYVAAGDAVGLATTALATAQAAVDAAQVLLASLQATLNTAITALKTAITSVLDGTPLVSMESLQLKTVAQAVSASEGGQTAEIVGGTVTGLEVLGTDVLQAALGNTTLDLGSLVGAVSDQINSTIGGLTGALSDVLSSVPGLPALDVPAPVVTLLTKSAVTSISGGFGRASTTVTGLSISLPAITVPTAVALPGAGNLPAFEGVTQVAGLLETAPVRLGLLTLRDQASFRPAVIAGAPTPGTSGSPGDDGALADTGLPVGLAVLSLGAVVGALLLRRRATFQDD